MDRGSFRSQTRSQSHDTNSKVPDENLVYGLNPAIEVLRAGRRKIHRVLLSESFKQESLLSELKQKHLPTEFLQPEKLDRLTQGGVHQGVVLETSGYPYVDYEDLDFVAEPQIILALDSVQDPQNMATLARSALAFGVTQVLLPRDRSVSVTPAVVKSSAGAVEHLKIARITNLSRTLEDLKQRGFWIYGTHLTEASESLSKTKPANKSVIVLGSEGSGLRNLVSETCDVLVKIPMAKTIDSLNVAQAGSILFYDFYSKLFLKQE